ncbi:MAG: tryptophan synthase subunit alpha, partial [Candidatus Omnitrophica bacterium]|nr:tryptophan synthase subunit alpha [Candidatus Omnitrophota bacterium]
ESKKIVQMMAESFVYYIEIQFPFSDPIADGKAIMEANHKALKSGMTTDKCFSLIEDLDIKTPLLAMTYFNVAYAYGLERFCQKAQKVGLYGLIIPDIPIDEEKHEHYIALCKKYSLHPIQIISPITPEKRLKKLSKVASGFVYCVSDFGITGERSGLNPHLKSYLNRVRKHIKLPLALGFGISSAEQVEMASKYADIVVVGSKLINLHKEGGLSAIKAFLQKIPPKEAGSYP